MNRLLRLGPTAVLCGLGLALLWSAPGPSRGASGLADKEDKAAIARVRRALLALTKAKDGELPEKAKALMKEADLKHVMTAYAPRARGGIGVGPPRGGDGIELKLRRMMRTRLTKGELAREKADLLRMARVIRVVNEVARHGGPGAAKKKAQWKKFTNDLEKANADFAKAIDKGDTKAIKEAAGTVQASCLACHDEFR
jgi:hypothetical protein